MSLDRMLGSWTLTMHHSEVPGPPVTGRQRYERTLDGAFVMLQWEYDHPDFPNAIALFSETECHYFDVRGVIRVFDVTIDDDGWSMIRIDDEFSQRFVARFDGPDAVTWSGDRSADRGATWEHDFTMELRRGAPSGQ